MNFIVIAFYLLCSTAFSEELLVKLKDENFAHLHQSSKIANKVYKLNNNQLHLLSNLEVEWVQRNHQLTLRSEPNDTDFEKQWCLSPQANGADVKVSNLWEYGTGGLDRNGHEVVVAVIDGGVGIDHQDLRENIWVNRHEIPGNGIDDDQNGYIDDVNGWNAGNDSGEMTGSHHGTHVAGIIGASGNNGLQVAGINWKVKVLPVVLKSFQTDEVLKAYQYVIDLKKQWIESNGEKGANIVATNSSFGIDYADCESGEYPAWNDFYNQMGKVGILSAAATANNNVNVDEEGDVPTGCSSPYIVTVTNTTKENRKFKSAGYGVKSVDLGAPGTNILSTVLGDETDEFTGTSMATPQVAGAVALLYSLAPDSFLTKYSESPGEAMLEIKDHLIEGVDPNPSLNGITVSGGKLNIQKSFEKF